jgi:hypothetical protein
MFQPLTSIASTSAAGTHDAEVQDTKKPDDVLIDGKVK